MTHYRLPLKYIIYIFAKIYNLNTEYLYEKVYFCVYLYLTT